MVAEVTPVGKPRTSARERVLDAARTLFGERSVSGTSLQMIADHLGVTKAAVYHQFHTKEEIILALVEKPLAQLESLIIEAEAVDVRETRLDVLLKGLVDIVLENPEVVGVIQADPAVAHLVQTGRSFYDITARLDDLLAGPHPDPTLRIARVLYGAGLLFIGHHPLLTDIDPDTMRSELPRIGRRMLSE